MRAFALALTLSLVLAHAVPAWAQDHEAMIAQMQESMAAAQAQAARPGDEDLTCEQLEAEMVSAMQDPAVQSAMAQQGEWAEGQMEAMNAARGRAQAQIGFSIFASIAASFIPGAGHAQMAAQQAMAAQQQRQVQQNTVQMMEHAQRMTTIMPQIMRGQRVHELAQARNCAFVQQQPATQE